MIPSLMKTASKASGRSGMKMKPYAIPFKANPARKREMMSGNPKDSEGPCKTMETASIKKDMRMRSLLGILPVAKLTKKQLIV